MKQRFVNLSERRLGGGVVEKPDAGKTQGFAGIATRLRALGLEVLQDPEAIFLAPENANQGVVAFEVLRRLRETAPQVAPLPEPGQMPDRLTALNALFLAAGDRRFQSAGKENPGTVIGIIGTEEEAESVMRSRSILEVEGAPVCGFSRHFQLDPYSEEEGRGAISAADAFSLKDWSEGRIALVFGKGVTGYAVMVLMAELFGRRQGRPPEMIGAFGPEGFTEVKMNTPEIWARLLLRRSASRPGNDAKLVLP